MSLLSYTHLQWAELLSAMGMIQPAEMDRRGQDLKLARHISLFHETTSQVVGDCWVRTRMVAQGEATTNPALN
jgi:hypothetical protein